MQVIPCTHVGILKYNNLVPRGFSVLGGRLRDNCDFCLYYNFLFDSAADVPASRVE